MLGTKTESQWAPTRVSARSRKRNASSAKIAVEIASSANPLHQRAEKEEGHLLQLLTTSTSANQLSQQNPIKEGALTALLAGPDAEKLPLPLLDSLIREQETTLLNLLAAKADATV